MTIIADLVTDMRTLQRRHNVEFHRNAITKFIDEWRAGENGYLSKEEEQRRVDAYNMGGSDVDIAYRLGIPAATFQSWRQRKNLPIMGKGGRRYGRPLGTNYEWEGKQCVR